MFMLFYLDPKQNHAIMMSRYMHYRTQVCASIFHSRADCISKAIRRVRNSQTSFPSQLIPYPQPATGNRLSHASGPVPRTGNLTYPPVHLSVIFFWGGERKCYVKTKN